MPRSLLPRALPAAGRSVEGVGALGWWVTGASPFSGRGLFGRVPHWPQLPLPGQGPTWPDVAGRVSEKEAAGGTPGQRSGCSVNGDGHSGASHVCVLSLGCCSTPPAPKVPLTHQGFLTTSSGEASAVRGSPGPSVTAGVRAWGPSPPISLEPLRAGVTSRSLCPQHEVGFGESLPEAPRSGSYQFMQPRPGSKVSPV